MDASDYRLFKTFRLRAPNYLPCSSHMSPAKYVRREQPYAGHDATQREIDWLRNNTESAERVHRAARAIRDQLELSDGLLENVYACACFILMGHANDIFRTPVFPAIRPKKIRQQSPFIARGREFSKLDIGLSYGGTVRDLYRGMSSDKHRNVAPIARSPSDVQSQNKRWRALSSFGAHLRDHPQYGSIFGNDKALRPLFELAFMQHFKKEAKLKPPLLDFTYDPLVALYFATSRPKTGEVGALYRFSIKADLLAFSDFGHLGDLKFVVLPGVKRLSRQRGVLLYSPFGDSVDQVVPFRLRFKQHEGIRFQDRELNITDSTLLHSDPGHCNFCAKHSDIGASRDACSRYHAYRQTSRPELTKQDLYYDLLRSMKHKLSTHAPQTPWGPRDVRLAVKSLKRLAAFHTSTPSIR